jgi:hypothetical protein
METRSVTTDSPNLLPRDGAMKPTMPAKFARLRTIERTYGLNRARIYELLSMEAIHAVKDGRALMVSVESVERYMATRPQATIRLGSRRAKLLADRRVENATGGEAA